MARTGKEETQSKRRRSENRKPLKRRAGWRDVPDEFWKILAPLVPDYAIGPKRGRRPTPHRTIFNGIPLNASLSGFNDHGKTQLAGVLDRRVVARPLPRAFKQHLCLDKGYDYRDIHRMVARCGYVPHIPYRGEEPALRKHSDGRPHRWVVERTNRWRNLLRGLKIRYEVHAENYLDFADLACASICLRSARSA